MKSDRKPAIPKPSHSKRIKTLHKRYGSEDPLKLFVNKSDNKELISIKDEWLHNKKANFSNPPQGIGNTKKKKSNKGGGKTTKTISAA